MATGKPLYFIRIAQLLFGIGFLIIISDASVHRGWWNNINGAVALGVIASILTLALTLHGIITRHLSSAKNPFTGGSTIRTAVRLAIEIIIFLCWVGSVALMLRGKGGCDDQRTEKGVDFCVYPDPHKARFRSDRPLVRWDIGVGFAFVEIVLFIASGALVFREDRATKVTGGNGGGASYA